MRYMLWAYLGVSPLQYLKTPPVMPLPSQYTAQFAAFAQSANCSLTLKKELKLANHIKPRPLLINIYKIYCTSTLNSCENFYPMENTF